MHYPLMEISAQVNNETIISLTWAILFMFTTSFSLPNLLDSLSTPIPLFFSPSESHGPLKLSDEGKLIISIILDQLQPAQSSHGPLSP